jgi:hypothetical protein
MAYHVGGQLVRDQHHVVHGELGQAEAGGVGADSGAQRPQAGMIKVLGQLRRAGSGRAASRPVIIGAPIIWPAIIGATFMGATFIGGRAVKIGHAPLPFHSRRHSTP